MECAICGKGVAPADMAPEIARLPHQARLPMHARCFQAYLEDSRRKGDAWARSARGRWELFRLRVRFGAMFGAAAVVTIVAAIPIAVVRTLRGWRLARAVRSSLLGASRGVVIVGYRTAADGSSSTRDAAAAWPKELDVIVTAVDIGAPFEKTDLARAVWEHWGSVGKPPRLESVIVLPRNGRVTCVRIGHAARGASSSPLTRVAETRTAIESLLSNADPREYDRAKERR